MSPKTAIFVGASVASVILDQATKLTIDAKLSFSDRIPVIDDFFYITHARNPGAAYGLFADAPVAILVIELLAAEGESRNDPAGAERSV